MAKNKPRRELKVVGQSQQATEKTTKDKFANTEELAHNKLAKATPTTIGRISPQLSCTIALEDKQMLNDLTIYAINKAGRPLNTSSIIRALIRLGNKRKEELEF